MPKGPSQKGKVAHEHADESKTWEADQKNRGYYYDDSHGYEVYRPELDDEEIEDIAPADEKGSPEN